MGQLVLEPFALVGEGLREALHDLGDELVPLGDGAARVVNKATLYLPPARPISVRDIGRE